jgi:hypothetical protein
LGRFKPLLIVFEVVFEVIDAVFFPADLAFHCVEVAAGLATSRHTERTASGEQ